MTDQELGKLVVDVVSNGSVGAWLFAGAMFLLARSQRALRKMEADRDEWRDLAVKGLELSKKTEARAAHLKEVYEAWRRAAEGKGVVAQGSATPVAGHCHDQRCEARKLKKHACHDLTCKQHVHEKRAR